MADLTVHTARWCQSNRFHQVQVGAYIVTHRQGQPHCTCKGFQFRRHCKHVDSVELCRHGWEAACGSPTPMGDTCPQCGGPAEVMAFGA